MRAISGLFKPQKFFQHIANKSSSELTDTLIKYIIFTGSFVAIISYMATNSIADFFAVPELKEMAITYSVTVTFWALSLLFLNGLVFSVIGKLFNVREKTAVVAMCTFWATVFFLIGGSLFLVALGAFLEFALSAPDIVELIVAFTALVLKLALMYLAIKVSMQTSRRESFFILILGTALTVTISSCVGQFITTYAHT